MTEERTTESPQKWWASGGDIPTINEVVERLRAEGNLDEEKWERFYRAIKKPYDNFTVIALIVFLIIAWINIKAALLLAPIWLVVHLARSNGFKLIKKKFSLYNLGDVSTGKVLKENTYRARGGRFQKLSYQFSVNGISKEGSDTIHRDIGFCLGMESYSNMDMEKPISIVFLSENNEINIIINQKDKDYFNVRKEIHDGN